MIHRYRVYWQREWQQACRDPFEFIHGLWFCLIVATLFPLALSVYPQILVKIAPPVLWITAILSNLLSTERLFREDLANGTLEQIWLCGRGLMGWALVKLAVHWIFSCIPLILLSPLLGYVFGLATPVLYAAFFSLLLGTPTLMILSGIVSALTLNVKKSGLLLGLLVLPLTVPVFVFGIAAMEFVDYGFNGWAQFSLLMAMMLLALAFGPIIIAYALKLSIVH